MRSRARRLRRQRRKAKAVYRRVLNHVWSDLRDSLVFTLPIDVKVRLVGTDLISKCSIGFTAKL